MGLDVYVGSLTRYYTGDWLTIIQQTFPGKVQIVRPGAPKDAEGNAPSAGDVQHNVLQWQRSVSKALGRAVHWNESHEAPYFTNKPSWDRFGALMLWAAYTGLNIPRAERLERITLDNWQSDGSLKTCANRGGEAPYPQLTLGIEIWLPLGNSTIFAAPDPTGHTRVFGSVEGLVEELHALNAASWGADEATRRQWLPRATREHPDKPEELFGPEAPPEGTPLEEAAKAGWSMMLDLAQQAIEHRLPVILDY